MLKRVLHENLDGYILRHRRGWNFDTAQRYLAAKSIIQRQNLSAPAILDVGSSGMGLSIYWQGGPAHLIDLDPVYPAYHLSECQVQATAERLPFEDKSFDVVVSIDMLEHVPPDQRAAVIKDMLRVSSRLLVLAVPAGPDAQAQDAEVARRYKDRRGQSFKFVEEHILYGLPEPQAISGWIAGALKQLDRVGRVEMQNNANLFMRSVAMQWFIEDRWGLLQKAMLVAMPVLYRLSWGPCYRKIFVVSLECDVATRQTG